MGPSALHEPTWDPRAKWYVPRGTVIGGWSGLTAMGDKPDGRAQPDPSSLTEAGPGKLPRTPTGAVTEECTWQLTSPAAPC